MTHRVGFLLIASLFCIIAAMAGCTDEETVYVERVIFEDPPAGAGEFLGYDDASAKLTVCGNCHVGQQSRWEGTAHANAWNTLSSSGQMQGFCQECHTVGTLGNAETDSAGYQSTHDTRYHDVQCESCHGPGLDHVTAPDTGQPLASLAVTTNPNTGCAECHTGVHHPFVEEWEQSKHSEVVASAASRAECVGCHTGQGALAAWSEDTRYIEENAAVSGHLAITCGVCHDPHSAEHEGQLRYPLDVPSETEQLCMKCHHKRANPEVEAATLRGPHSPEGPLLLGEAGWWPPNINIVDVETSHGPIANEKLCATCHVASFTVTDEATGAFTFQATGHLFEAIPCLDGSGIPVPGGNCDVSERAFQSCASSGCHATETQAENLYALARQTIDGLVADVDEMLTQVPPGERDSNDGVFTVADGAWFNARLGELPGSGIHNPFLMEQLLRASIDALTDAYGVVAPLGYSPAFKLHGRSS
ncbi:MAG TPA: multiheme c-type cytochrome [Candidatus Eisenbacteria bacterium]|nr:multiheme c-type cytochrome [Candidatus Eisenbacteria bacterium]